MIDRDHELAGPRQAEALGVSRSAVYYKPRPTPAADLQIMRRIDELHLDYPFAGSRMLRDFSTARAFRSGAAMWRRLMKRMGIEAIYRRPNTSKPAPGHKIYPYLLARGEDRAGRIRSGRRTSPTSRWRAASSTWWRSIDVVQPAGAGSSGVDHDGGRASASRRWRRLWPNMASRRSSTPTRAANSPASPSPACC